MFCSVSRLVLTVYLFFEMKFESEAKTWLRRLLPICFICGLYLCAFDLFLCATNSLVYSTICLLHANESFCAELDRNRTLRSSEELIQREASQWSLYGTLAFAIISTFVSPIYGSLSDRQNRKLPIVLTICNAILTGILITIGSFFRGTTTCLFFYILSNVVNGFGGGSLILISSCFGYATDRDEQVPSIAIIEASLNIGVIFGYVLCTFVFKYHAELWQILVVHVGLLLVALLIALICLERRNETDGPSLRFWTKVRRPFVDTRDLLVDLQRNRSLIAFLFLLGALFFYEFFRMGSPSIFYLYLHRLSFNDTEYATYFTCEQTATSVALILLAVLRKRSKLDDLHIALVALLVSCVGLVLFAFAENDKSRIFAAIPSMMFAIYFPVCLRVLIRRLVADRDRGKAFSFVALVQNFDVLLGTVVCIEIYQSSLSFFSGLIFLFAVATRLVALLFLLIPSFCWKKRRDNPSVELLEAE